MKKYGFLLVLFFSFVVLAYGGRSRYESDEVPLRMVKPSSMGFKNAVFVDFDDNLQTKYDWLKSSDRDGEMGALSSTNRRMLILSPGLYTLTSTLTLDTDYVDVSSMTPESLESVIVTGDNSANVITQTCKDIRFSGFTIKATANYRGLVIDCADKDTDLEIEYQATYYFKLIKTNIGKSATGHYDGETIFVSGGSGSAAPQLGTLGVVGSWGDDYIYALLDTDDNSIDGTGVTYHFLPQKSVYRNMRFVSYSTTDDTYSGCYGATSIGGTWLNCRVSSNGCCWLVADTYGINADFTDCIIEESATGTRGAINWNCAIGSACNACEIKGTFDRCKGGQRCVDALVVSADIYDCIFGSYSCAGGQANDTYGAREFSGKAYRTICGSESFGGTHADHSGGTFSGYAKDCRAKSDSFGCKIGPTVNATMSGTVVRCIQGALVDYATGTITANLMRGTNFSGICINSHPFKPTACTSDTVIYPFYSGHTFTNEGDTGARTFTLPLAAIGLFYTVADVNDTATVDPNILPTATDRFILNDGTAMDLGEAILLDGDEHSGIEVYCYDPNVWIVIKSWGTVSQASP